MIFSHRGQLRSGVAVLAVFSFLALPADAATLNFTVNTSKPVNVAGTPRIALTIGPETRYATYKSGSGSSTLTFGYDVQAGDFDADGIAVDPAIDLNGGTITSTSGSPAALGFTAPNTSGIKIQTYTVEFFPKSYTLATSGNVGFKLLKPPASGTYSFTITGSGGGSVGGGGNLTGGNLTVSGISIAGLTGNQITLSVTVSAPNGGTGAARTDTATLDVDPPAGYGVSFLPAYVNALNSTGVGLQISGAEVGASYTLRITSNAAAPGTPVTRTDTITAASQQITGLDLSGLGDGVLTASLTLTDAAGNPGAAVTAQITKDVVVPTILSVTPPAAGTFDDL